MRISAVVNANTVELDLEPRETLLDVLRGRLGLTGTHDGCEQGACGACTVLIDGELARACVVLGVQVAGRSVATIESVGAPEHLHPVQEAMSAHHGLQCGFCTPGMVLAALDLLARVEEPDESQVRTALAGNLCRCTGYGGLVAAVVAVGQDEGGGRR
ncbi:MAG: (2Fe-2S)-binding protein [Actinomycetota bacterium]|nr:(2Fe-2S)-binding protein [Actinomycetota bacterium]